MKKIKIWFSGHSLLAASITGTLVASFAGSANGQTLPTNIITGPESVTAFFCGALVWMFWGLVALSVAMFLVGGYLYATSAGDAEKVGRATKTLTYAAIGVAVALIARGIPILIGSFLGSADAVNAARSVCS